MAPLYFCRASDAALMPEFDPFSKIINAAPPAVGYG